MKAIETEYNGHRFRSRLEARWAVFFDACGVKWEYEPEGFDLYNGDHYLPDFELKFVLTYSDDRPGNSCSPLWAEVKGNMDVLDWKKVVNFAGGTDCGLFFVSDDTNEIIYDAWKLGSYWDKEKGPMTKPDVPCEKWNNASMATWGHIPKIITLGNLFPDDWFQHDSFRIDPETFTCRFGNNVETMNKEKKYIAYGFCPGGEGAFPGIDKYGRFAIFRFERWDRFPSFEHLDLDATRRVYEVARTARFEHGEAPTLQDVQNYMKTGRWKS